MNQAIPLAVDLYTRTMVDAFDERKIIGVPTGFQSMFGRPATGGRTVFSTDAKLVEIDIIRGNERLAVMIQRGAETRPSISRPDTAEQTFTSISRQYPLVEEEGNISADQILNRLAGDNAYLNKSKMERMRELAYNHHAEHIRRIGRLMEYLARQAIVDGIQDAIFGTANTDLQYDFYRLATHTITPSTKWDNSGDIMGDIDDACGLIRADGKVNPDFAIVGGDAMEQMLGDTTFLALADNRRIELIQVSTNNPVPPKLAHLVAGGFIPRGRLRTIKGHVLWLFSYTDVYTASGGTATLYMDGDEMLIGSSEARCDRYFGPAEMLPRTPLRQQFSQEMFGFGAAPPMPPNINNAGAVIRPDMFYFDAYEAPTHKSVTVRTQASPIFAPVMTDAFATITDVLT